MFQHVSSFTSLMMRHHQRMVGYTNKTPQALLAAICLPPYAASGPGCANMNLWRDKQAKRFCANEPLGKFSAMLTTHFYTKKSTAANVSHTTFLHEDSVRS
jgi:hypothetical protein